MTHDVDIPGVTDRPAVNVGVGRGPLPRAIAALNAVMVFIGMIALLLASFVLTYSVFSRYLFKAGTDWQDEVAVFSIVGAVFLSGAWVQSQRGHIGIDAIASILPESVNRVRRVVVDILSLAFCAFFAWKSWTLFHEAWVDKMTTSSTFSPPLTIPYGLMAAGMTLLVLQLALQTLSHFVVEGERR
jgi:TRAP-type C4-dicarboxylate transport system permease small subunit